LIDNFKNPKVWLHGLIAAIIGGGANSVCASLVAPDSFNIENGECLVRILKLFLISGTLNALFFLKENPLPSLKQNK